MRDLTLKLLCEGLAPLLNRPVASLRSQISRDKKLPGFPVDLVPGRDPMFNLEEVCAWFANNPATRTDVARPVAAPVETPRRPTPPDLIEKMARATTALERARLAEQIAGFELVVAAETMSLTPRHFQNLTQQGEELRKAEKAHMDLQIARGELIERDNAKAKIGEICQRLIADFDALKNSIATQVELWITDASFVALTTEERARLASDWVDEQAARIRTTTADEIDAKFGERKSA